MTCAFQTTNRAKLIAVTTSSQAVVLPVNGGNTVRIVVPTGSDRLFVKFGASDVVVTKVDGGFDYMLPSGVIEVLAIPADADAATYIALIADIGSMTVTVNRGNGL